MTAYPKSKQIKKTKPGKTRVIKSIAQLKKSVQILVNKYVRLRDKNEPCISCGKFAEHYDAGHYLSQGSTGVLRYDLYNINKQCKSCNQFKHGNLIEYRLNLVRKIGENQVRCLEAFRKKTKKWTREELEELQTQFKGLVKDMQ